MTESTVDDLMIGLLDLTGRPICGTDDFFQLNTDPDSLTGRKLLLFQFATVWTALRDNEKREPRFASVRQNLVKRFFGSEIAGYLQYDWEELLNATGLIGEVIDAAQCGSSSRLKSWAQQWFTSVGLTEHNPIYLGTFATNWVRRYATVNQILQDVRILD